MRRITLGASVVTLPAEAHARPLVAQFVERDVTLPAQERAAPTAARQVRAQVRAKSGARTRVKHLPARRCVVWRVRRMGALPLALVLAVLDARMVVLALYARTPAREIVRILHALVCAVPCVKADALVHVPRPA